MVGRLRRILINKKKIIALRSVAQGDDFMMAADPDRAGFHLRVQ
jgi:hypothetical protein